MRNSRGPAFDFFNSIDPWRTWLALACESAFRCKADVDSPTHSAMTRFFGSNVILGLFCSIFRNMALAETAKINRLLFGQSPQQGAQGPRLGGVDGLVRRALPPR
jgi:hypothetical protein